MNVDEDEPVSPAVSSPYEDSNRPAKVDGVPTPNSAKTTNVSYGYKR